MAFTMSPAPTSRIFLADYSPDWPRRFEEEHQRLQDAIGEWAVAIEHVGSTSIPGIAAKPIIDIAVALSELCDALFCITPLTQLGYVCLGEFGIAERIYFRKDTATPLPGQTTNGVGRTHQIHMYARTHPQFINHLALRDYLRANPGARQEYEDLKRRLAAELDDIEQYADAKSDLIRDILQRAQRAGLEVAL
jgi:GrpB-like predicted nucleotidyltransferase (UPF0157 family)